MTILLELIKELRKETGAGIQDCRKALEETGGSYELALSSLREKMALDAAKRTNQQASQGMLHLYSHGSGRIGVMVEVNTETDFASRSGTFQEFSHEVALQIAAAAPHYACDEDVPAEVLEEQAQKAAQKARAEGKPEAIIPRITAGQLEKYRNQHVLLRQAYIRDEQLTVAQLLNRAAASLGEKIVIRRFVRWEMNSDPNE